METINTDVVLVDSTSNDVIEEVSDNSDKPLMMLFERLIGNDNKQNTVLTNAQIIDILQKEFNVDIIYFHELEIDIYLNILKKFLKDWPQWDEFDSAINELKSQKEYGKIKSMLETNYQSLKAYLKKTLENVEPLIKDAMKEVKVSVKDNVEDDNIIMQLQCTREQLNHLFFRRPHPLYNNALFNLDVNHKIRLSTFNIVSILNWPDIRIYINLNGTFVLKRDMILSTKHVLVNKKLNHTKELETLNRNFQMKGSKLSAVDLCTFLDEINDINTTKYNSLDVMQLVTAVCNVIRNDMQGGPNILYYPAAYRRCLSNFPYVRHLYSEVNAPAYNVNNNYDIQLEETGTPYFQSILSKVRRSAMIPSDGSFIKIECLFCKVKFQDGLIIDKLKEHFEENHPGEPDWECTKCKLKFSMEHLTRVGWTHECSPSP